MSDTEEHNKESPETASIKQDPWPLCYDEMLSQRWAGPTSGKVTEHTRSGRHDPAILNIKDKSSSCHALSELGWKQQR